MKRFVSPLQFLLLCAALLTPALSASAQDASDDERGSDLTDPASAGDAESVPAGGAESAASDEAPTSTVAEGDDSSPASDGEAAAPVDESEQTEAAAPAPEPSPFRGSLFSFNQAITANTLNPSAQLTYDPTYYWSFFVQPRFYLDRQNFLILSQGMFVEWTDANWTTTQREPQLSDTVLEWRHLEVIEGFVFIPAVRLAAPLSNASQAADRVLNTGVGLTIVKVFPEAASFTIAVSGAYRRWWALGNVATTSQPFDCRVAGDPTSSPCDQVGGFTTERDRLLGALTMTVMPIPGLTILSQYALSAVYGHPIATTTIGEEQIEDDGNHWRNQQYWTIAVAYDVLPWLNLTLGYQSASFLTDLYNPDGSVRNPFYNPESEIYLTATIALDVLGDELFGADESGVSPEQLQRRRQGLASRGSAFSF